MAMESMAMGDAGVTALVMVGVGCVGSMAGKYITYSYVGLHIVWIFRRPRLGY